MSKKYHGHVTCIVVSNVNKYTWNWWKQWRSANIGEWENNIINNQKEKELGWKDQEQKRENRQRQLNPKKPSITDVDPEKKNTAGDTAHPEFMTNFMGALANKNIATTLTSLYR